MNGGSAYKPKWAREIERFIPIKPQFLLYGNINDVYPAEVNGVVATLGMCDYLKEILSNRGYALIAKYEPMYGFSLVSGDPETFAAALGERAGKDGKLDCAIGRAADAASGLLSYGGCHTALILRFASRLEDIDGETDVQKFFYRMFRLSLDAVPRIAPGWAELKPMYSPVFWITDKENDLPPWYTMDNPRIRVLPVPRPDNEIRGCVVESVAPKMPGYDGMTPEARRANLAIYRDQTSGLLAGEIAAIAQMAHHEAIPFARVDDAIRRYKLGIQENMWEKLDPKKITGAEEFLNSRVMGQETAVRHAADILKRSRFNLSGAQFSRYSQRPKGVLFLAGPTGVGKTELAKAITELIFGSPTHYIRFDMSEFGQDHANQRLVGAPPGYVGYDVGGELTNAIKQNPFSVVLFDEIEKAHPRILDIFLQILDDGRLTSGRGETVYFSESVIVFTSNLGMFEQLPDGTKRACVTPDMNYMDIARNIGASIDDFFKYKINRPEILNRIGRNVVVFDFIREDTAAKIFDRMLGNVLFRLHDNYGVEVLFDEEALRRIRELVCADLSMGGRGIGSGMELILMNPLSRKLCEIEAVNKSSLTVRAIVETAAGWELAVERSARFPCAVF
ncbi:MAG: AAA family ATPase [Synergistaceae bacterium]|jgi:ATP-dependent protease Clp ATPase subunit|nr:AAA family ATPase [Synergistaceae bacterium]